MLFLLSNISIGGKTVIEEITRNYDYIGGIGQSLKRFKEIDDFNHKSIDILFLGSSHCYRSFDPRIFAKFDLETFNMGSSAQTPLNSYYLLKRYFNKLNPKLLVLETYPVMFCHDGLESFYDLSVNLTYSKEILEMAIATKNSHAINSLVSKFVSFKATPPIQAAQREIAGEFYISGGYVETKKVNHDSKIPDFSHLDLSNVQMKYLRKIIEFVKKNDSEVILVIQPMPKPFVNSMINYDEISDRIRRIAEICGIKYFDFNEIIFLREDEHFKDFDHLNASGVKIFNETLISLLITNNILHITEVMTKR